MNVLYVNGTRFFVEIEVFVDMSSFDNFAFGNLSFGNLSFGNLSFGNLSFGIKT
jgi:hypothetical protein